LFGFSRQGWYEHQKKDNTQQHMAEALVLKLVQEIRKDLPRSGVPQLYELLLPKLKEHEIKMGRDALYKLLGTHGYLLRYKRRKVYTTNSKHRFKKHPNLIREIKYLTHPGQLWVSDITYLRLKEKFAYLSIITDAYSHKIIGHCLLNSLHSNGPINALLQALKSQRGSQLIHHSDRGTQYCCDEYVQILEQFKIKISMTENGDPYENAIAERVNGILKTEFLLDKTFNSFNEAYQAVTIAIEKYNKIRPHSSCDNLTPETAHKGSGVLYKRWKSRKENDLILT
jgi:putative transposase